MKNFLLSSISVLLVGAVFAFSVNPTAISELFTSENSQSSSEVSYSTMMVNCPPATADPYIGGKVFKDIDMDGQNDANVDQPVENVTVTVFDLDGTQVGTALSEADGTYLIASSSLNTGEKYRVEFSAWSDDYLPSFSGTNNASDIQFVSGSTCGVDFALTNPNDYCQSNPTIVTSCYAEGDQTSATDVLVSFDYNNPTTVNHEAIASQIGTTYGLAYQRNSGKLFAASFLKRFAGFPAGNSPSSIYMISNPNNGANEAALFVDLDDLSGAPANVAGADIHDFSPVAPSNEILDAAAFDAVGKYSFGDIDLASDELSIYAMNLFDRSIYQIPLGTDATNPVAPTAFSELNIFPLIGNLPGLPTGITTDEIRPFALKVQGELVYIGVVTSGQDGNIMQGLVYSFDIASSTPAAPAFTKVLEFPLTYDRGCGFASTNGCAGPAAWNAWVSTYPEYPNLPVMPAFQSVGNATEEAHPQPMFTDIEFDAAGNMIIGMRDRLGDQGGLNAPYPSGNQLKYFANGAPLFVNPSNGQATTTDTGSPLYLSTQDAFGDILKATKSGSSWNINIADFTDSSLSSGVSQAGILVCPDGESSFGEDCYHADGFLHEETAMGGLAVLLRNNQIVTPSMDPARSAFSNGIDWFDANNGALTQYFEVLTGATSPFGKSYGLGEIEFICDMPPVQVGNYVWQDDDDDGIQDANEEGIAGVGVTLYKNGTPIATTLTATDGSYYFSNQSSTDANLTWLAGGIDSEVLAETEYTVRLLNVTGGSTQSVLAGLSIVEADINSNANDKIDNDGVLSGTYAEATAMSGKPGEAKHDFDFGFAPCETSIVASNMSSCSSGTFTASISLDWINAPVTGDMEYNVDGGAYQTITRTNFSADATAELIEIPNLVCNATKKISLRFIDTPDCFEDLVFLFPPTDPAGYLYCDNTGLLVTGGTISVTPPAGGSVNINQTGVDGYYSWLATGSPVTEGIYTMTYSPPASFTMSGTPGGAAGDTDNVCDPSFGTEDNPANDSPLHIGTDINAGGTALDDFSAAANPFFLEFNLELSDPFVDLNNIGLAGCLDCSVDLTTSVSGCTDNGNGTYTATIDVTVSWRDSPDPAEVLTVTLDGANAQTIATGAMETSSTTIQFNIAADGSANHEFAASFVSNCSGTLDFKAPVPCATDVTLDCAAGIAGTAYNDADFDGTNNDSVNGIAGVEVQAYDCNNTLIETVFTDADGEYQFSILNSNEEYRIEFLLSAGILCDYKPTIQNTGSQTTVQFVTADAGTCTDLGLVNPLTYCDTNPQLITPCYVEGLISAGGVSDVLVSHNYDFTDKKILALKGQIGSTWGVAYNPAKDEVYTATFLKRHVGLGPNGLGAIYTTDPNAAAPNGSLFFDLASVDDVGDSQINLSNRDLSTPGTPSLDLEAVSLIGKVGLGDIDMSTDNEHLYTISLASKKLWKIPTDSPNASNVESWDIPNLPAWDLAKGDYRPFALKFYNEKLYIGITFDASISLLKSDLEASIYEFDPAVGSFTELLTFPMGYNHGRANASFVDGGFHPWKNPTDNVATNYILQPQPVLSDIELGADGTMVLGFFDRSGHQFGSANFNAQGNKLITVQVGGEMLRVGRNPADLSQYQLESNGQFYDKDGTLFTGAMGNNEGPDGGEFYLDAFIGGHNECSIGGIAVLPGSNEVIVTALDPAGAYFWNGFAAVSQTTGVKTRALNITPLAAKANGLGDIELRCNAAPVEVGNLVWLDANNNGIQDACEAGIENVQVQLYSATCTLVGVTQTNGDGNYTFNATNVDTTGVNGAGAAVSGYTGLSSLTTYYVVIGDGQWDATEDLLTVDGIDFVLSDKNEGTNVNIDSDGMKGAPCGALVDVPFAEITTESNGCHSHDVDFGLTPDCPVIEIAAQQATVDVTYICAGESIDLKITYSPATENKAIYSGPAGLTDAQLYDTANHGTNGITAINATVTPTDNAATMSTETSITPTATTTYYTILASGNTLIVDPTCLPMDSMTVVVNPQTPTAVISAGPHDLCSEDSPLVSGTDNVIDLQSYITSGNTTGVWTSSDALAGSLTASTFTATTAMEGTTYNFDYTIAGTMTETGNCDDNVYSLQISVKDCYASIGNLVWEDTDGDGTYDETGTEVEGIKVTLFEAVSGVKGSMVAMDTTDTAGLYLFDLLPPGEYAVQFDLANSPNPDAANFTITEQNSTVATADDTNDSDASPTDGCTAGYVLAAGDEDLTVDAGVVVLGKIGDYVWEDTNGNGVQDETGTGISSLDVTISGTTGAGTDITTVVPNATIQTNTDGSYCFTDLPPGNYQVTFGQPTGLEPTLSDSTVDGGDETNDSDLDANLMSEIVTLMSADTIPSLDAGFYEPGKIGNYVWEDTNGNGVQDETGTGIGGVEVTISGTTGGDLDIATVVSNATIQTNTDGSYCFTDLPPGDYKVTIGLPTGMEVTPTDATNDGGDDTNDSDLNDMLMTPVVTIASGDTIPTLDAGFYVPGKIGNFVWEDLNGNGVQDTGEPGIGQVEVTLSGTDGQGNTITPIVVPTNADGSYCFTDLPPGEYKATFAQPTGLEPTFTDSTVGGGDDTNDSDLNDMLMTPVVTIESGDTIPTLDAGFFEPGKIGDFVWEDTNGNGIQDETGTGIEGVTVTLTGVDGQGNAFAPNTTETLADGSYCFTMLPPGDYEVTFETPTDMTPTPNDDPSNTGNGDDTDDSDADTNDGMTSTVTLVSGDTIPTLDAGYYTLGKIGDIVWEDVNANGIQDIGEPGIADVAVTISGATGTGIDITTLVPATVQTNADGAYCFTDLPPGEYVVTFEQPEGYEPTALDDPSDSGNNGNDDGDDSDADPTNNLMSPVTTLVSGDTIPTIDAGFYVYGKIGDFVWEDYNQNGIQDTNEPGIEGVTVALTGVDGLGNTVSVPNQTTNVDGMYCFGDLVPGTYSVTFTSPDDMNTTDLNDSEGNGAGDDTDDNDADPTTGSTQDYIVESQDTIPHLDAGFYATDYGDNPDSFGTTEGTGGASHVIAPGKYLGSGVDAENDASPSPEATGDNSDSSAYSEGTVTNGDDEDGIQFLSPLVPGNKAYISVTAFIEDGSPAFLTAWIDFNGNGTFDANEQAALAEGANATANLDAPISTGTTAYCFDVPADATFEGGETHARFRLSCAEGTQATGQIIGGEVEDYYIPLMKVGNLVWQDVDNEGDQDELVEYGLNDIAVHLTWEGLDGIFGNADDIIYVDTTTTENGVAGKYCFIGVTPGDYQINLPEYPANFQQAPIDATGDDTTDNDGDNYQFTITDTDNQPTGESSTGDEPGNVFPDNQDDLTIDIALVAFDFGDLPDDFATTGINDGAYHVLEPGLFLGVRVDAELDGSPDPDAGVMDGGDNDGGAQDPITGTVASDEEGIEFLTPLIPGNPACIRINGGIPSGVAYLKGWIDFNGDGDFTGDADEELVFTQADAVAITPTNEMTYSAGTISQKLTFMVPATASFDGGETHFRFRFGREQAVSFSGEADGGEVEDYWRPLAKVGNLVWREYDEEGDQDEAAVLGLNGVQVNLIYEGEDATIGTADDVTYTVFTAEEDGVNGKYNFCGLTAGNYQVVLPTIPENMIISPTEAIGNPILDADPLTVDLFIENPQTLFPGENGTGDDAPSTFPTENDLLVIDFAFSALDFGDLPATFANTTDADNGAYHVINPSIYLGQGVDSEVDGAPETQAGTNGTGGDDQTASAVTEGTVAPTGSDEDGIEFISPIIPGEKAYVRVTAHAADNPAVLNAWIDLDGDGTFAADGSEQIMWTGTDATTYAPTAEGAIAQGDNTQIMCFEVPEDAVFEGAETHVRVRLSTEGSLTPTEKALDGEVEDYFVPMAKVGNIVWRDLDIDGQQDPEDLGMNDILIELTTAGPDGIISTADDYVYQTTSAPVNGQDGMYQFCGLQAGDYIMTCYGDGSLPTKPNETGVPEDLDSDGEELVPDGPEVITFTIDDLDILNNQPTVESGIGDNPNDPNFPDPTNNLQLDFGYQGLDYGDLPNTFVTLQEDGGASHVLIQDIFLGDLVDLDTNGAPTYEGTGDNNEPSPYTIGAAATDGDDEEGITFLTPLIPGEKATISVKHTSTIGEAFLNAWIDWNGDGIFAADGSEQVEWTIVDGSPITPTKEGVLPNGTAITQEFCFDVPPTATFEGGETHIRVRMSTEGNLTPTGLAFNGEVEDYFLPVAKVGNVVWFDEDLYGDEDEAGQTGINDFSVELIYAGVDGILDTDDDILYTQITQNINGQDGSYFFCGLIDANYRLQYSEYPTGMISAIFDNTGTDFNDSDADFDFVSFAIENGAETGVINENEVGDATNPDNFPDERTDLSIDFAFVNTPTVAASLSLQGVQEPTSETCGNFDAIYQTCIQNTGDAPLENIQAMFDFTAADMFGDAYVSLSVAPIILSDNSQETPQFSAAFDGSTAGKNLFDGASGLLFPTEEICVQFTVELRPVEETAPPVMQIQSMVTGGAVNYDGTAIPDILDAQVQFVAGDLSDDGLIADDTNPTSPNDTGIAADASALNDCFESEALACNDLVQISVNEMCSAGVSPDMILENLDPACGEDAFPLGSFYTVTLMNNVGQPLPNNEVTAAMYGEEISVKVRHIVSCNECWGSVIIEDKNAPEFDCPTDPVVISCTDSVDDVPAPIAMDNCNTNGVSVTLVNESTDDTDLCGTGVVITREYTAIDEQGNQTEVNCIQTIEIQQVSNVDFPEDIVFSCEQYAANTNIVDATALTITGLTTSTEFVDALDATAVTSAAQLASTGAGVPNVAEGLYCNFAVTSSDEILSVCDSENTFKIVRTWTVLNWCTNSLVTIDSNGDDNIQFIKVVDITPAVITIADITISANVAGEHPQPCASTATLPAASIIDNCSGVASVEIHTPIGTIFGNGGNIPAPGLEIGTHNVTYVATDGCGNTSEVTIQVTVVDDLAPTPVCEEITQVAIGADGIATVLAETFDDGSNDNCGVDFFEVRRMSDNCAIAGNTTFGENVKFCCADIDTEVMVEFRVVDYYGNANTCMVQVLVEDKLAPIKLNNPADEAIDCDDYFVNIAPVLDVAEANGETNPSLLVDLFGAAIYDDNCEAIVTTAWSRDVNSCGQGTITRTWAAVDPSGNVGQSCTQIITVNHVNDWNVQFPADVDLNCVAGQDELDGQDFGEPTVFDDDCELIAMSSQDQVFDVVEGACYQMIRTWTVINWCVYDGDTQGTDDVIGARRLRDGGDGIITYIQQITVTDEVAPVVTNPGTQDYCINTATDADGDCDMNIQLPEAVVTDCSDDVTVTYAVTDLGTGRNYSNVAPGIYEAIVTATDGCGNQSTITYDVEVRDCKAPTPYCVANLIIELMPMDEDGDGIPDAGMVETWANDFNAGSFDNCTAEENLVLTATIGEDNFDASTSNLLFDCTTTGAQAIYMYVTDEAGNTDYCLTTVFIESVDNVCPDIPSNDPFIAGAIMTEEGNAVELTEVHVNGATNSMMMTTENGLHSISVIDGGDYTVSPLRDDDHDNGVTTFDLVLIRQHVLNTSLLSSPYKMIAADANNSGSVTTSDIVLLRQLILTVIDELPANTSWRFVDAAYEFENPTNPWATEFPEITNYNNVNADILNANFVGIKIGDVNGTVQANLTQSVEERGTGEVIFRTQDAELKAGEEYTVNLGTAKELRGYQFTLDFDTDALEFIGLGEQMKAENFGLIRTEAGAITVSIDRNPAEVAHSELTFKVLKDRKLSEVLNISSRFTKSEAYDTNDNLLDISLEFGTEENPVFVLLQNTPNPWSEKTTIGFNLPTATRAEIRIHDASGKTLRVIEQSFETGYNEVTLDGKGLGMQSVLFYTITTDKYSATKSMVRVK